MPHMSHSITNVPEEARLQCKYTSATHKEALVSPTVKMPFLSFTFTILCLATEWQPLRGHTL